MQGDGCGRPGKEGQCEGKTEQNTDADAFGREAFETWEADFCASGRGVRSQDDIGEFGEK